MRYSLLIVLACMPLLTSCMVTYHDFPEVDLESAPFAQKDHRVYYQVVHRPYGVGWMYYSLTYANLERLSQDNPVFAEAIAASDPPNEGVFYSVDTKIALSGVYPGVLTPRDETQPNVVMYSLYVDGELKRNYVYAFNRKVTWWFLAAPVILWANLFTPTLDDPLRATFYQFLLDAERDGYLQVS